MSTDLRPADERPDPAVPPGGGDDDGAPPGGGGGDGAGDGSSGRGRRRDPSVAIVATLVAVGSVLLLSVAAVAVFTGGDDDSGDVATEEEADGVPADDPDGWGGVLLGEPDPRPDFTLTDVDTGEPFDFREETGGRLTLLFFGYTSCPDICPIQMHIVARALDQAGMPQPDVVFVATDPERDTPERVREWLDERDSDFIGLVGTEEEVAAAEEAAGVAQSMVLPDDADGNPVDEDTDEYLVGHASQVIAYTPDDLAHVVYPEGTRQQDYTGDLPRLLDEFGSDGA